MERSESGLAGQASYRDLSVVEAYAVATELQGAEKHLFSKYIADGSAILDLGVGGGRTAPHLSAKASCYVGVDYSPEMIEACKQRYPNLKFECRDAMDLFGFGDSSFDVVVFSFNGIGHLYPNSARAKCLSEIHRVLRPNGWFIFSVHNARGLLLRPRREGTDLASTLKGLIRSLFENGHRIVTRIFSKAFWQRSGYLWLRVHGKNRIFLSTPDRIREELKQHGLILAEHCHDQFPQAALSMSTRWFYYASQKRG